MTATPTPKMRTATTATPRLEPTTDETILQDVRLLVNQLWGLPAHKTHLPCPCPSSLSRQLLRDVVRKKEYFVAEKTNGVRMFMLFGAVEGGAEYCVLIDRAYNIYTVQCRADPRLYQGTLLDGEMVPASLVYTVFDCYVASGYSRFASPFFKRRQEYESIIRTVRWPFPLTVFAKQWHPLRHAATLWEERPLDGSLDGLILQPKVGLPVTSGVQTDVFKWKPPEAHTIDFYLSATQDGWVLEVGSGPHILSADRFGCYLGPVEPSVASRFPPEFQRLVVECAFVGLSGNRYYFLPDKIRSDKLYANDAEVVKSTLAHMMEGLLVSDF